MSGVPAAPRDPQEAFSIRGMQQSLFPGVSCALEVKDSQERPRAHLLQPETSSLPPCPARAAGGFTVNKTTAESDFPSGRREGVGEQPLSKCPYPLPQQHILLRAPVRSANGGTAISRQLSARQGAMPAAERRGKGKAELVPTGNANAALPASQPRPQALAGVSLSPARGALAQGVSLCLTSVAPRCSRAGTAVKPRVPARTGERMLQKRTKPSVYKP